MTSDAIAPLADSTADPGILHREVIEVLIEEFDESKVGKILLPLLALSIVTTSSQYGFVREFAIRGVR